MAEFNELQNKPDIPALKKPIEEIEESDDDPEIAFLERMLAEKRAKRKLNEEEM